MTKKVYTLEKGWHEVKDGIDLLAEGLPNAAVPSLAPAAAFVDHDIEPINFKLPFKRVLNGHIIVKIDKFKYKGRIGIPDSAKRKPTTGSVVGVAPDVLDVEMGDKILYSQFAGYLLKFQGLPLLRCIGRDEVLAVLFDDSPEVESEG